MSIKKVRLYNGIIWMKECVDMIKSMTGFGRSELEKNNRKLTVEIKSVNHRYLDISVKLPKKLNFFEASIRNVLKEYISRGKVDVYITYEDFTENTVCVRYNKDVAAEYYQYLNQMASDFDIRNDISVSQLSRFPEVFTLEEQTIDEEQLWELVDETVRDACRHFVDARIAEGDHLKEDIHKKLDYMGTLVSFVEERSPEIVAEYRNKIMNKVAELLGDTKVDESILATEITIFADKTCVDEETVRLRSHIKNMIDTLSMSENIGRKLDFIAQEMNREANTILSKANDIQVSNKAIDLKTEIEKIREQIQNIE